MLVLLPKKKKKRFISNRPEGSMRIIDSSKIFLVRENHCWNQRTAHMTLSTFYNYLSSLSFLQWSLENNSCDKWNMLAWPPLLWNASSHSYFFFFSYVWCLFFFLLRGDEELHNDFRMKMKCLRVKDNGSSKSLKCLLKYFICQTQISRILQPDSFVDHFGLLLVILTRI